VSLVAINRDPSRKQLRWFGALWLPLLCGSVFFISWRLGAPSATGWGLAGLAAVSALTAALAPRLLAPVFVGLSIATWPIGFVVSHVLLAVLFYALIAPIGVILRLCGRDAMMRRLDPEASSYWVRLPAQPDKKRYFRQY